jgi:serine phosphatase RsbU (regulator of sigma subunit)
MSLLSLALRCFERMCQRHEPERDENNRELRSLHSEVAALKRATGDRDHVQGSVLARLREEAAMREGDLAVLRERLDVAEHELDDLRAIRAALTPPELPKRPGLELAAVIAPAAIERVSDDFLPRGRGTAGFHGACRRSRVDGRELTAPSQGTLLGTREDVGCVEGALQTPPGVGVLLYTDGLTEARHAGEQFG